MNASGCFFPHPFTIEDLFEKLHDLSLNIDIKMCHIFLLLIYLFF